jgi:uncharacterized damage-inducible protein DinB
MTQEERTFLLERLGGSEARLLALVEGLSAEQWTFREGAGRWSIAENVEHLVLFERFIRGVVVKILATPAEPEKVDAVMAKHQAVLGLAVAGEMKIQAREVVCPAGTSSAMDELKETLWRERAETIAFVRDLQVDLREHFFAHLLLGDLDAYQWLLVIAQHSDRHAAQIKRVMSDARFPHIAHP